MAQFRIGRAAALAAFALSGLIACRDRPKPPTLPPLDAAFKRLVLPPAATLIGRSGSEDALQLSFRSTADRKVLVAYYRAALTRRPWTLVSDTEDSTGAVTLYAEEPGPPMWVRIAPDPAGNGVLVDLAGAVPKKDSTAVDTAGKRGGGEAGKTDSR